MANSTVYPYGQVSETPAGIWDAKMEEIQNTLDLLAPLAFRDTPNPRNPLFTDVMIFPVSSADGNLRLGVGSSQVRYMLSPIFDVGEIGESVTLRFSCGEVAIGNNTYPSLLFFDENGDYSSYYVQNANPRTVTFTVSAFLKYIRIEFPAANLLSSYIFNVGTDKYLFDGSDVMTSLIKYPEEFLDGEFIPDSWKTNSRGDYISYNFTPSTSAATAFRTDYYASMYKKVGSSATQFPYSISRVVELPRTTSSLSVEFSVGSANSNLALRLLNPSTKTANYYSANADPRTITIDTGTWTHVQLYFLTADYADCYIKDATNNVMLWEGAPSTA